MAFKTADNEDVWEEVKDIGVGTWDLLQLLRRQEIFDRKISAGYDGPIIVSEGDSWFNCRGIVGPSRWFNVIHPTTAAFADIAARFRTEIQNF